MCPQSNNRDDNNPRSHRIIYFSPEESGNLRINNILERYRRVDSPSALQQLLNSIESSQIRQFLSGKLKNYVPQSQILIIGFVKQLIQRNLLTNDNISDLWNGSVRQGKKRLINIFKDLSLLAQKDLLTVDTFNKITQNIDKFEPIINCMANATPILSFLNPEDLARFLESKHSDLKSLLLNKLHEKKHLTQEQYNKILNMTDEDVGALIQEILKNTFSPKILRHIDAVGAAKLIEDKMIRTGSSGFIGQVIDIVMALEKHKIINTNNGQIIFNILLSATDSEQADSIKQLIIDADKVLSIDDFNSLLNKLSNNSKWLFKCLKLIERLKNFGCQFKAQHFQLLLNSTDPVQLLKVWDMLESTNNTNSIQEFLLEESVKEKFNNFDNEHKKLLLFLFQMLLQQGAIDIPTISEYISSKSLQDIKDNIFESIKASISPSLDMETNLQPILQNIRDIRNFRSLQAKWSELINEYSISSESEKYLFNALWLAIGNGFRYGNLKGLLRELQQNLLLTPELQVINLQLLSSISHDLQKMQDIGYILSNLRDILPGNQELFNRIVTLENIANVKEAMNLLQFKLDFNSNLINILLEDEDPKKLAVFWLSIKQNNKLPDMEGEYSQYIDQATYGLYSDLDYVQKQIIVSLCKKSLEQSKLDSKKLKTIIQQVKDLEESDLLDLIIPEAKDYLDNNRPNMQLIKDILPIVDASSWDMFTKFFDSLIKRNIITKDNQLGQAIFEEFIRAHSEDSNNIKPDSITSLYKVVNLLSQLNLLGSAAPLNDTNLEKLLANIEQTEIIYNILYILTTKQLINSSNAQAIFNQIIKLPDKDKFNEIIESAQHFGIQLQPKILQLLFKVSDNEQQSYLFKMWTMFYSTSIQPLVTISTINSIDATTKESFASLTPEHQQLLLSICKQLMTIDMPVDFNMFAILVNTPQAHLAQLNQQLFAPDLLSSSQAFDSDTNLQFLAIYTKAVHQQLYYVYKQESPQLIANDIESSMQDAQLKKANERFAQLRDNYGSVLEKSGGLEQVEAEIRKQLLITIRKKQPNDRATHISQFIDAHGIDELAKRAADPNHELTKHMRQLLVSTSFDDPEQIAWRAYDSGAATVKWPNLLTPSSSDATIFSTREARAGMTENCNMATATAHARTYAALAFLASKDEKLQDSQQADIWNDFLYYIADIRRAHNDGGGTDNPSCFPGTISRIAQIINKHPDFVPLDEDVAVLVKNSVRAYINMQFKKSLEELTTLTDKETLFFSLMLMGDLDTIMLNQDTIFTILPDIDDAEQTSSEEKQAIIQKYMQARAKFFTTLSGDMMEYISNKLRERNINVSSAQIDYLISDCLVNISSLLSINEHDIYESTQDKEPMLQKHEHIYEHLQYGEVTSSTEELAKPNASVKDSPNKLVAIQDYWIPQLKLEVYERLQAIIKDNSVSLAIIDELFIGCLPRYNAAIIEPEKFLTDKLRSKNIEEIFKELTEEGLVSIEHIQQIDKTQIQQALASVCDTHDQNNTTLSASNTNRRHSSRGSLR